MGYAKNILSGWEMFTSSPVFHLTVDFKKVVSDLVHAGSTLVESKCIKIKRGIIMVSKHNNSLKTYPIPI